MQSAGTLEAAMTEHTRKQRTKREKGRAYYRMMPWPVGSPSIELLNPEEVAPPPMSALLPNPFMKERGFQGRYKVPPRLMFGRIKGRNPTDFEGFQGPYLVSDRMKAVLEQVDPEGFDFVACEVILKDGSPGPRHWLCDVIRILDAVDETVSSVQCCNKPGEPKRYGMGGNPAIRFREDVVGAAHVFRMRYAIYAVVADDVLRKACKAAGLKRILFAEIRRPEPKN